MQYPTPERIIDLNTHVLRDYQVKKKDRAEVLSRSKLLQVLADCQDADGDLHEKAALLLSGIIRAHPFASGNRRTALLAVKDFLVQNAGSFEIPDNPSVARVLQGVREGFYSQEEIREWIEHGKIREFKR